MIIETGNSMSKQYGLRLSEEDAQILDAIASKEHCSPSDIIRKQLRSLSPKFEGKVQSEGRPRKKDVVSKVQDLAKEVRSASKRSEGLF